MGICNPRPAMRAKESRDTMSVLRKHETVRVILRDAGIMNDTASSIAFDIITTHKQRKQIWRTK